MLKHFLLSGALLASALSVSPVPTVDVVRESAGRAPGDDFDAYANGDWLAATDIPEGKNRWSGRNEIDVKTAAQIKSLLVPAASAPTNSIQRKMSDFYSAYMADSVIEQRGIAPIAPLLKRIHSLANKTALADFLGSDVCADVDPLNVGTFSSHRLFGLAVERGIHGHTSHFAYLVQGGLGMPRAADYLDNSPQKENLRAQYQRYIGDALSLAGFDNAPERSKRVFALEVEIARHHASEDESSKETNADNRWSTSDLSRTAPGMDWPTFLKAAGLSNRKEFVAWQPDAIRNEAALVGSVPLDTWKDYLRFHVVDRYADVLPRAFSERAFSMRTAEGLKKSQREQRALDALNDAMPELVGQIYAETYFPALTKARLQKIVANVVAALTDRIATVQWMAPETKARSLSRLKTLYFGVGYPEKWPDSSPLTISPGDAVGNLQRTAAWKYQTALRNLDQPAAQDDWVVPPQFVGAVYMPLQNAYNFPAGLLQAPKFDPAASDATAYGAIGSIIGHELTHFVDALGADYDDHGGRNRWWTAEDTRNFERASEPLVAQFFTYKPFPDLAVDGKLTRSENIADLGGLAAAFDAYRRTLGNKANDRNYVTEKDREFFLGFARAWRVKLNDDALRTQVTSNDHAPERFRIATVRNIDAWYAAFDVQPGQKLYLAPKERVRVW